MESYDIFTRWLLDVTPGAFLFALLVGGPTLVLVHELGHAAGALLVGLRPELIKVGGRSHVKLRLRSTSIEVSAIPTGGGHMRPVEGQTLTPRRLMVVSAGGPVASGLSAAAAASWARVAEGWLELGLYFTAIEAALAAMVNLFPHTTPGGQPSDGALLRAAWRARKNPPATSVSVPPPRATPQPPRPQAPTPDPGPVLRWPFAVLLGIIAVAAVPIAILSGVPLLIVMFVVIFGLAYQQQTGKGS